MNGCSTLSRGETREGVHCITWKIDTRYMHTRYSPLRWVKRLDVLSLALSRRTPHLGFSTTYKGASQTLFYMTQSTLDHLAVSICISSCSLTACW